MRTATQHLFLKAVSCRINATVFDHENKQIGSLKWDKLVDSDLSIKMTEDHEFADVTTLTKIGEVFVKTYFS